MRSRRGLTKIEVVVVILGLLVVVVIGIVIFGGNSGKGGPMVKDGSQMRAIHQSWLIFANEYGGVFPIPGAIRRKPVMQEGVETLVPGQGDIDITQNTTAHLYGSMIMQNYFSPQMCVGPTEPSDNVFVHDTHNWELYDPSANIFWDDTFAADLDTGSNVSYAHKPLFGAWMDQEWRVSIGGQVPLLSNRGPRDGIDDPQSITYQIYGPPDKWVGNIVFSDNHVELSETFTPRGGDNVFRAEDEFGDHDAFLTFTKQMTKDGPVVQWD